VNADADQHITTYEGGGQLRPVAAILAFVFPGLGYIVSGERKRGILVASGILFLFLGGMLIGGIDVVDRAEDRWWFLLQGGVGPTAFAMDWINQNHLKNPGTGVSHQSLSHVNEVGSLATAMAGMLNMIAIVDCLWAPPVPVRRRRTAEASAA